MGYSTTMINSDFFIADGDKYAAYKKLKEKFGARFKKDVPRCLEEFLEAYGYYPENDSEDNICGLDYSSDKYSDDEYYLFQIIAPFVKTESFIEIMGEDGEHWRWKFLDGRMLVLYPKITWPEE